MCDGKTSGPHKTEEVNTHHQRLRVGLNKQTLRRWDGAFIMPIFFPGWEETDWVLKFPHPQHIHVRGSCHVLERVINHQRPRSAPRLIPRPSTRELPMIHRCCNGSSCKGQLDVAKGSVNPPWTPQGWCLGVPTHTWTHTNPLDFVLGNPRDHED